MRASLLDIIECWITLIDRLTGVITVQTQQAPGIQHNQRISITPDPGL